MIDLNLVIEVNDYLKNGLSIREIEELKSFGKDTLRKKMRKLGYKFDRKEKIYVIDNIDNTKIEEPKIIEKPKKQIKNTEKEDTFTKREIEILKKMVSNFETKNNNIDNLDYKNSKVVVRSFRSYEKVLDEFASYCRKNELNQKDAIAIALLDFIKKNKE